MSKKVDYNKPLRSTVLICSIRAEEAASDALRSMLRTVKGDSKTLSNKSSSLSFKNKIDLLYDIEDLEKEDYVRCLKFMEIRNQFIHNPKCNNFIDLKNESPDLPKFLNSKFPNQQDKEEDSLQEGFKELWTRVMGTLLTLKIEYSKGQNDEMIRFVNAKTMDSMDEVCQAAYKQWNETKPKLIDPHFPFRTRDPESLFSTFEYHLNMALFDKKIEILDSIEKGDFTEKDVFERRKDLVEELKKRKAETKEE